MDQRTQNVIDAAAAVGANWSLLSSPDTVAYAARHVVPFGTGPSPFDGGPTLALVGRDGSLRLVCSEIEHSPATCSDAVEVREYESLGFSDQRPLSTKYREQLEATLAAADVRGPVAVEAGSCPPVALIALGDIGRVRWIDGELARRRAIKTEIEIDLLRRCASVTAIGQAAARRYARAGVAELHVYNDVRLAMELANGVPLVVAGDFVSGRTRTANIGGSATNRIITLGDPIISDLAPRIGGYWGDSCTSFIVGRQDAELSAMYGAAYRALESVHQTLRPGIVAGDFDASIRQIIANAGYANPIHLGHGIGTSVHEWPRIVPGQTATLEPGMVLMLEPGAYRPDVGGVRLEQMFLITETGNTVLSPFDVEDQMPVV